jgi:MFS family permease
MPKSGGRWHHELTRYHWFVLFVASLGWMFDCLDQQIFVIARQPAIKELLAHERGPVESLSADEVTARNNDVRTWATTSTSAFLIGWALGGLGFGILGDRIGRVRTMLWTILIYSVCTGLSALSQTVYDFSLFRFMTGMGVGGEFAVGVALVAEVMPDRARPYALGLLQALSAVGNISAALLEMGMSSLQSNGAFDRLSLFNHPVTAWRVMFVVGTVPALLAVLIRRNLKEPERWQRSVADAGIASKAGSYAELFGDPRWRKNAIVGFFLAFSGVVGLWGIGFFTPDVMRSIFTEHFVREGVTATAMPGRVGAWIAAVAILQNVGGFCGIWAYSRVTHHTGRKPAFAVAFLAAMFVTAYVFWNIGASTKEIFGYTVFTDVLWMIPIMGFCQLALFGGYAIYFPELFPTRLRSTGTSFCYNVGRLVAAVGPAALGLLSTQVFQGYGPDPIPYRYSAVVMCSVFAIGLIALPFAPETRGKPLPD